LSPKKLTSHPVLNFLLPFLIVCVFAISALLVTSSGLQVYYGIQQQTDAIYQTRTGISYLTTKLRQVTGEDTLRIENNGLVIGQTINGQSYETHIYLQDGVLRESFIRAGDSPGMGTPITRAQGFTIANEAPGLITFTITDDRGNVDTASVFVMMQKEAAG